MTDVELCKCGHFPFSSESYLDGGKYILLEAKCTCCKRKVSKKINIESEETEKMAPEILAVMWNRFIMDNDFSEYVHRVPDDG